MVDKIFAQRHEHVPDNFGIFCQQFFLCFSQILFTHRIHIVSTFMHANHLNAKRTHIPKVLGQWLERGSDLELRGAVLEGDFRLGPPKRVTIIEVFIKGQIEIIEFEVDGQPAHERQVRRSGRHAWKWGVEGDYLFDGGVVIAEVHDWLEWDLNLGCLLLCFKEILIIYILIWIKE